MKNNLPCADGVEIIWIVLCKMAQPRNLSRERNTQSISLSATTWWQFKSPILLSNNVYWQLTNSPNEFQDFYVEKHFLFSKNADVLRFLDSLSPISKQLSQPRRSIHLLCSDFIDLFINIIEDPSTAVLRQKLQVPNKIQLLCAELCIKSPHTYTERQ